MEIVNNEEKKNKDVFVEVVVKHKVLDVVHLVSINDTEIKNNIEEENVIDYNVKNEEDVLFQHVIHQMDVNKVKEKQLVNSLNILDNNLKEVVIHKVGVKVLKIIILVLYENYFVSVLKVRVMVNGSVYIDNHNMDLVIENDKIKVNIVY